MLWGGPRFYEVRRPRNVENRRFIEPHGLPELLHVSGSFVAARSNSS